MKTCPACHRSVPDDATTCPHVGCGRPLPRAGGAAKRPPPPGPVRLTSGATAQAKPAAGAKHRSESRRNVLASAALLLLLLLLVGGVYYAWATGKKPDPASPAAQVAKADDQSTTVNKGSDQASAAATQKPPDQAKPANTKVPPKEEAISMKEVAPPKEVGKTTGEQKLAAAEQPSEPLGLYSQRTRPDREKWIANVGGTSESELGVAAGLDWLARHQGEDGHWGPDCLGPGPTSRCEHEHPCGGPGQNYDAALTGLPVLAFQAGGNYYFNEHAFSDNVRRGLDWLVARQGPNGELVGPRNRLGDVPHQPVNYDGRYMYEHAIATFALAEACAVAKAAQRHPDEKYLAAAIKAVKFIEDQQHSDGGWRYTSNKSDGSDASVSGWVMLALKTAKEAELPVQDETMTRMTAFFKKLADPLTGRTHYQGLNYVSDATTGVGMMVDEFVIHQPDSELVHLAAAYLADQAEERWGGGRMGVSDFYLWYNCTLAMFMAGGETWKRWNDVVRNHIILLQLHGASCDRGSWEPSGAYGNEGGRIFSTSLCVLALEVYYRFSRDEVEHPAERAK